MINVLSLEGLSDYWGAQLDATVGSSDQLDIVLEEMIEAGQPVGLVASLATMLRTSEAAELYELVIGRLCQQLSTECPPQSIAHCVRVAAETTDDFGTQLGIRVLPQLKACLAILQEPLDLRIELCYAAKYWLGTAFEFMLTRLLVCVATSREVRHINMHRAGV